MWLVVLLQNYENGIKLTHYSCLILTGTGFFSVARKSIRALIRNDVDCVVCIGVRFFYAHPDDFFHRGNGSQLDKMCNAVSHLHLG